MTRTILRENAVLAVQAAGYTTSNVLIGVLADFASYESAFLYGTIFSTVGALLLIGAPVLAARAAPSESDRAKSPLANKLDIC